MRCLSRSKAQFLESRYRGAGHVLIHDANAKHPHEEGSTVAPLCTSLINARYALRERCRTPPLLTLSLLAAPLAAAARREGEDGGVHLRRVADAGEEHVVGARVVELAQARAVGGLQQVVRLEALDEEVVARLAVDALLPYILSVAGPAGDDRPAAVLPRLSSFVDTLSSSSIVEAGESWVRRAAERSPHATVKAITKKWYYKT